MKTNKIMRVASVLLVAVLLTTCVISGTFAKYTTTTSSDDTARVAVWGINKDAVVMDLFDDAYSTDVKANDGDNVIAPGTTKTSNFSIVNASTLAPEVKYSVTINLAGSQIADYIKNNPQITWKLDEETAGTWDQLMTKILRLSGDTTVEYEAGVTESVTKVYDAGQIATEFANGETHTITWVWNDVESNDATDTEMGNAAVAGDINVKIVVAITATQINE